MTADEKPVGDEKPADEKPDIERVPLRGGLVAIVLRHDQVSPRPQPPEVPAATSSHFRSRRSRRSKAWGDVVTSSTPPAGRLVDVMTPPGSATTVENNTRKEPPCSESDDPESQKL
jgi:hypothetical protein